MVRRHQIIGSWSRLQGPSTKFDMAAANEKSKCKNIDAQLCNVIKSTLHPNIKPIFCPHITCDSVRSHANELYPSDTQHLFGVCHKLINIITPDTKIVAQISPSSAFEFRS